MSQSEPTPLGEGGREAAVASGLRGRALVGVVFVAIAAAYVASVPGVLLVNPDTAVYMGLGRSLARGEGYTFNFEPYAKYPPVFPLMLAAVYRTAGENIRAMQTLGALSGVAALVAAYGLVAARAGRWPALGVAALAAACTWFQSHASVYIRADVPYTMFSLVVLWAAERRIRAAGWSWVTWGGVALLTAVALYTHLAGVALVAAVGGGMVFAREPRRTMRRRILAAAVVGAMGGGAAACWLYRGRDIANPMANYSKHSRLLPKEQTGEKGTMSGRLARRLKEWARTPLNLDDERVTLAVAVVGLGLLVVPGLAWGLWRVRSCSEFYVLSYLAVSTLAGGPTGLERYAIPVVPLLLYYGYASLRLWGRALGWLLAGRRGAVVVSRVLVVLAGVAALAYGLNKRARCRRGASKFSAERRARDLERVAAWQAAAAAVAKHVGQGDLVYPSSGNTWAKLYFFAECRVAEIRFPDVGERCLRRMAEQGAKFLFTDNTNDRSRQRVGPLLREYPGCFEELESAPEAQWALYRINAEHVRAELARLDRLRRRPDEPGRR